MNYAHVVIGLMEGELQATVVPNWTPGSKERQLFFCSKPGEDLEGDVIIASENGVSPASKIPLDFEVLKGLDDLLMMVAAFAYPETDTTFFVYNKKSDKPQYSFSVGYDKQHIRHIISYAPAP